jgi:hypothetical protein
MPNTLYLCVPSAVNVKQVEEQIQTSERGSRTRVFVWDNDVARKFVTLQAPPHVRDIVLKGTDAFLIAGPGRILVGPDNIMDFLLPDHDEPDAEEGNFEDANDAPHVRPGAVIRRPTNAKVIRASGPRYDPDEENDNRHDSAEPQSHTTSVRRRMPTSARTLNQSRAEN